MSELIFNCAKCGNPFSCDESHRGTEVSCPSCSTRLSIPRAEETESQRQDSCPNCKMPHSGTALACAYCGTSFSGAVPSQAAVSFRSFNALPGSVKFLVFLNLAVPVVCVAAVLIHFSRKAAEAFGPNFFWILLLGVPLSLVLLVPVARRSYEQGRGGHGSSCGSSCGGGCGGGCGGCGG